MSYGTRDSDTADTAVRRRHTKSSTAWTHPSSLSKGFAIYAKELRQRDLSDVRGAEKLENHLSEFTPITGVLRQLHH